ncbi:MAG: DUF4842 domain-containing protein [Prevotella sp.]|nr:DUF4842 domain-containing protein [Prevotella sp.]
MRKNHLMKGTVLLAALSLFTACDESEDYYVPTKAESLANAKQQLGIDVAADHDWVMTAKAEATVTVNQDYGETYTVKIYSNDPLVEERGYVLTQGTVGNGQTFATTFEYPSANSRLVVGLTDSKGFTVYKKAVIADGKLTTSFGSTAGARATRSITRSMESPSVPHITIPNDAYAKSFLEGAKEPTDANINDNYDNSYYVEGQGGGSYIITQYPTLPQFNWGQVPSDILYNSNYQASQEDRQFFDEVWNPLIIQYNSVQLDYNPNNVKSYIDSHNQKIDIFLNLYNQLQNTGRSSWMNVTTQPVKGAYTQSGGTEGYWVYDENYVKKFKITGTYNKIIGVLPTEQGQGDPRTVYISGKWTLPEYNEQKVGGGAVIVVDNGGELVIPTGASMTFVNEARLVVMPGGKVSGSGTIKVTNGNAEGLEGYNGGTIDVGTFNNNFGKFYNYGSFKCIDLMGGAGLSNFYNHGVAHIVKSGMANEDGGNYNTPNTRIYNACQWYCEQDMRAYVVELTQGSYFYVGGELMMSDGNDGQSDNSYVALASGALMRIGSLWNMGTTWLGPESGYAVLEVGRCNYFTWDDDGPISKGYFANNIAISVDTKNNACKGKSVENAFKVFSEYVANGIGTNGNTGCQGNNGVVFVRKGCANVSIPQSENFVAGVSGCTPGYNPSEDNGGDERPAVWSYAFEDTPLGDYDMNDVVIKVSYHYDENLKEVDMSRLDVTLCCTGATFNIWLRLNNEKLFSDTEVHDILGKARSSFVNTVIGSSNNTTSVKTVTIETPDNFSFQNTDFWIKPSAAPEVHLAEQGSDPHAIVIPTDWDWPTEFTRITVAYPEFAGFAEDPSQNQDWYLYPSKEEGKIFHQ